MIYRVSWTAAAVDASLQLLTTIRVPVSDAGYRPLRRFGRRWSHIRWAIEGATGLGAPLTYRLSDDGVDVVDVPAKLAARVRLLSTGHGAKTTTQTPSRSGRRVDRARAEHRPDGCRSQSDCARSSNTVTARSRPAPKPSTGCTSCSLNLIPAGAPRGPRGAVKLIGVPQFSGIASHHKERSFRQREPARACLPII